jgi:hypothetical protein
MARKHADQLTFQESLIELLKQGRWAAISGESRQQLANRLGVTLEALEQADRERAAEQKQQHRLPRQLGNRAFKRDYAIVGVTMPPKVYEDWKTFCATGRYERAMVLRSLIHHFLLVGNRPRTTGDAWHYMGELLKIQVMGRGQAKTRVTAAARIALDEYADRWNVSTTGIVRGIITDTLEVRKLPVGIHMITVAGMYGDSAQYLQRGFAGPSQP